MKENKTKLTDASVQDIRKLSDVDLDILSKLIKNSYEARKQRHV